MSDLRLLSLVYYSITQISGPMGKDGNMCPNMCPTMCGKDEMYCWGGMDDNYCMMPDFCIPSKGKFSQKILIFWNFSKFENL